MKKKVFSFLLAAVMLLGTAGAAFAADLRASYTLDSYYVGLSAEGNGVMMVSCVVNGVGVQDKIGVRQIDIEYKTSANGEWEYYDTLYGAAHPDFYAYGERSYLGEVCFDGEPGHIYRVLITAYAKKGSISDTGYVNSPSVTCK